MITIVEVLDKKSLRSFIDFPHILYGSDHNYVPELFVAQHDMLKQGRHPFHHHAMLKLFLAFDENQIVGRIAGIINSRHNEFNEKNDGFFGFFDVVNRMDVTILLMNAVKKWQKSLGMTRIIGPVNFSTNESCGLLIDGFEGPPVAMMPYNHAYYEKLIEGVGFYKYTDLLAHRFVSGKYNQRAMKLIERLEQRLSASQIRIRKINMRNFQKESDNLRTIYNQAWDKNLGFVPMSTEEFDFAARDLKRIIDPDFCLIAEKDGTAIGMALAIPDINQVLIKIKRGRLFPTGLLKLLLNKKKINGIRILLLGVHESYRRLGIEACLYGRIMEMFEQKDMQYAEASWTLEDNEMVNRPIRDIGGKPYRRYRLYERKL